METIDFDLPCERCRYNLRTLRLDAVCPECGEPVVDSAVASARRETPFVRLRERGVPWMLNVREGLRQLLIGWGVLLFGSFLLPMHGASNAGDLLFPMASVALICVAGWRLFSPGSIPLFVLGRASVVVVPMVLAASGLNARWAYYYFGAIDRFPWRLADRMSEWTEPLSDWIAPLACLALAALAARIVRIASLVGRGYLVASLVVGPLPLLIAATDLSGRHLNGTLVAFIGICGLVGVPTLLIALLRAFTAAIAWGQIAQEE